MRCKLTLILIPSITSVNKIFKMLYAFIISILRLIMLITKIIIIIMIIIIKSYVYYFTLIVFYCLSLFNCYAKDGVEDCKDNQKYFTNLS